MSELWLSPTQITRFVNHYQQWYDEKVLGQPPEENIYMVLGGAIHKFLEDFFSRPPEKTENISQFATQMFKQAWENNVKNNEKLEQFWGEAEIYPATVKVWLERYIRTWVEETQKSEKRNGSQKAFVFNSPALCESHIINYDKNVHGWIDAVYHTKDKYQPNSDKLTVIMSDYKTSSKNIQQVPLEYFTQLAIYGIYGGYSNVNWVCVDYLKYNSKYYLFLSQNLKDCVERLVDDVRKHIKYVYDTVEEGSEMREYKHKIKLYNYIK